MYILIKVEYQSIRTMTLVARCDPRRGSCEDHGARGRQVPGLIVVRGGYDWLGRANYRELALGPPKGVFIYNI